MVLLPTTLDYVVAPWYLRMRWYVVGLFQTWCNSFAALSSPEQAHHMWGMR